VHENVQLVDENFESKKADLNVVLDRSSAAEFLANLSLAGA
jgi:hypothetical protein